MASSQWLYIEQRLSWRARHEGRHCLRWVRPLSYLCPSPPSQTAAKVESLQNSIPHELFSCPLDILQLPSALLAKLLVHTANHYCDGVGADNCVNGWGNPSNSLIFMTLFCSTTVTMKMFFGMWVEDEPEETGAASVLRAGNEGRRECQQHLPHLD